MLKCASKSTFRSYGRVLPMDTSTDQKVKQLYEFGPFRVDPEKELLLRGSKTVPLTPKTFQVLLVLVRHSKEVVTKDDLMKMVWPTRLSKRPTSAGTFSCCERLWERLRRTTSTSSPCPAAATGLRKKFR
jgi:DNA-binding winged helix-turn-helix (wHTH) protein